MTIRLTITRGDKTDTILTGDSYKTWIEQAAEFIYRTYGSPTKGWRWEDIRDLDIEVEKSHSKWKSWGGLKWCDEASFQYELGREGVQQDEPDNPKPRQYSKFKFVDYPLGYDKLIKELKRWY